MEPIKRAKQKVIMKETSKLLVANLALSDKLPQTESGIRSGELNIHLVVPEGFILEGKNVSVSLGVSEIRIELLPDSSPGSNLGNGGQTIEPLKQIPIPPRPHIPEGLIQKLLFKELAVTVSKKGSSQNEKVG